MKKNRIISISLFILGIIVIIIGLFISNSSSKKDNNDVNNNKDNNLEDKVSYKCYKEQQNIEFATVDSSYEFDYQAKVVSNQRQVYVFKFINENLYNQIGITQLFTDSKSPTPTEVTDSKKLTKTYSLKTAIPYSKEIVEIDDYIKTVESYGYICK